MSAAAELRSTEPPAPQTVRLFLCGDVMVGRGVDQVLPRPCNPILQESYVESALDYVRLAEEANGAIPRPVVPSYIWGRGSRRVEPYSAGCAHHQSRNSHHAQ